MSNCRNRRFPVLHFVICLFRVGKHDRGIHDSIRGILQSVSRQEDQAVALVCGEIIKRFFCRLLVSLRISLIQKDIKLHHAESGILRIFSADLPDEPDGFLRLSLAVEREQFCLNCNPVIRCDPENPVGGVGDDIGQSCLNRHLEFLPDRLDLFLPGRREFAAYDLPDYGFQFRRMP